MNNSMVNGQNYNPAMQQQMNPMMGQQMQNYGQPTMGGQYNPYPQNQGMVQNQQYEQKPNTTVEVARSNYTTIGLFEFAGAYDPAEKFPKAFCFVMGVPGVKDNSKQSGRTYNQDAKITMKFSTKEIRSLGHALINIAVFKQAAAPFEKHSDPSKNSYSQNNGDQNTKKLKATFDQARGNIAISMNYGQKNVLIPVPLQDALGLGEDLINLGNYTDCKLFDYKFAHKIGREEITGIDYDPVGTEDHSNGMVQQQMNPQQMNPQQMNPQQMNPQQMNQNPGMQYNMNGFHNNGIPTGMGIPGAQ